MWGEVIIIVFHVGRRYVLNVCSNIQKIIVIHKEKFTLQYIQWVELTRSHYHKTKSW